MLNLLDWAFHFFHLTVIIINLTFWIFPRTLRIAQITQLLTLLSWFGFGMFYGFGYCFLTDWQWQLKERMGEKELPMSYIKLVLDRTTGQDWNPELIDRATLVALLLAVVGCLIQTFRNKKGHPKVA